MDKLIQLYPWKKVIYLNEKQKKSKYFEYIKFVYQLKKHQYNNLFFSNFGSIHKLILANIKRKHTYFIDDGVETITRYHNVFLPNKLNKITFRQLRFLLAGLKISIKDDINLFTYFDLDDFRNSKIIKNDLTHFQKKYLKNSKKDNNIYLLGQPLVSTHLLKEEDYFSYLELIQSTYKEKIVYIPHRTEIISDKLQSYNSDRFEIRNINMPVELYFLEQQIYPKTIISFMTTAFFTLKKFYPKTEFYYVYIPKDKILERQDDVENAYKFIKKLNIQKITIGAEYEKD
ncbi:hypothetical protein MNB_SM-3-1076 [hydrothermal vent metagenome]